MGTSTTLVTPAAANGSQGVSTDPAVQAGNGSQGVPAVALNVQTSNGNASSDSQDGAGEGSSADRKGAQGSSRANTSPLDGEARVGMGGWVASTAHLSGQSAQGAAAETAPLSASSGMTNMSLDRIASESSARRLTNALRSDMNFGVQTDAFGKINIQAALHGDQLASQISLEHAHLHASALAAHMPVLEFTLGEKYRLDATVTVRDGSATGSSNQQSPSQESDRQHTAAVPVQKLTSTARGAVPSSLPSQDSTRAAARLSPVAGRLDLVI